MATLKLSEEKRGDLPLVRWIGFIILAIAGLVAWGIQLNQGMSVTGLNQQVVWGLYIAGFFTAAGAGAGLLVFIGLSEFCSLISKTLRTKVLLLTLVSFIIAGILIAMDAGNPVQVWRIATAGRWSSMMTWDFWALGGTSAVTLIYLWVAWRSKALERSKPVLGVLALISGLALVAIESRMLAVLAAAHPLWGWLTVLGFLVSAAIGGLGLALLSLGSDQTQKLRQLIAIALGISLVLVVVELLAGSGNIGLLLIGTVSPFFGFR